MSNPPDRDPTNGDSAEREHPDRERIMRGAFEDVVAATFSALHDEEFATVWFEAERSQYIRFNHARVRQAGRVDRPDVSLRLIRGDVQATEDLVLTLDRPADRALVLAALARLREAIAGATPDPWLLVSREPLRSDTLIPADLAQGDPFERADNMVAAVERAGAGRDLVGFLADGPIYRGFAGSTGAHHWFEAQSSNLEFSIYVDPERAVKRQVAGPRVLAAQIGEAVARAGTIADWLRLPPVDVAPGQYRALLEPAAVAELMSMFGWGGFSQSALRTGRSTLSQFHAGRATFSPLIDLHDAPATAGAPRFTTDGFVAKPDLPLIRAGQRAELLISPRTAREFDLQSNGARASEAPGNLQLAAGTLVEADALSALGTGLWIGNLWYLNWSDRTAARVTGMTRFASFWVEDGRVIGPINKLRFDDSLYRVFGSELEALGAVSQLMPDSSTYAGRRTDSSSAPSALLRSFSITL